MNDFQATVVVFTSVMTAFGVWFIAAAVSRIEKTLKKTVPK